MISYTSLPLHFMVSHPIRQARVNLDDAETQVTEMARAMAEMAAMVGFLRMAWHGKSCVATGELVIFS